MACTLFSEDTSNTINAWSENYKGLFCPPIPGSPPPIQKDETTKTICTCSLQLFALLSETHDKRTRVAGTGEGTAT